MDRKEQQGSDEDRPDPVDPVEHQDEVPSGSSRNQEEPQANQDQMGQQDQVPLFPFLINGQSVPHIGEKVFQYLDQESLLKFRAVSTAHKTYVDTKTPLWKNKSMMEAVIDEGLDNTLRLQIIRKILERKKIEWNIIKQKILKAIEEDKPHIVLQLSEQLKKFLDESDKKGRTPLHEATKRGQVNVCLEILNSHVHKQNPHDNRGWTPLHEAACHGLNDIARIIMERIAMKNPPDNEGKTPLHVAATHGHDEIAQMIVDAVTEKNPPDECGRTPLLAAAENGHAEIVQIFMDTIEERNPPDWRGRTPLHWAAKWGHAEVVEIIMDRVEDINPADNLGDTPLHEAAQEGHLQVVQVILDRVVDKQPQNYCGWTPLKLAELCSTTEMCDLIKSFQD